MVLFDPLTHLEESFVPPAGVEGGIVGDTDKGILAVYDVPGGEEANFEVAIQGVESLIRFQRL